jgi:Zn-dependent peptidase ImmA (M78 family)
VGACLGQGRDRFTIMHELGHLLLHTSDRIWLRRGHRAPKAYRDPEWQANAFAGEFLMPAALVRECSWPADMAETFGVSLQAAEIQLEHLKRAGLLS